MGLLDNLRSGTGARGESKAKYGLEQAAKLLRSLPPDNMELALTIVKKTLESFDVDVGLIVREAEEELAKTESEIEACGREVAKLREKVAAREAEVAALRASHAETLTIKQHLEEVRDSVSGERPALRTKSDGVEAPPPPAAPGPASVPPEGGDEAGQAERSPSAFFKRKDV